MVHADDHNLYNRLLSYSDFGLANSNESFLNFKYAITYTDPSDATKNKKNTKNLVALVIHSCADDDP